MDTRWCLFACVLASAWVMTCSTRASKERNTKPYRLVCVIGKGRYNDKNSDHLTDIDYSRCTHFMRHAIRSDWELDKQSMLNETLKLRETNPNVTQLLALNNWAFVGELSFNTLISPDDWSESVGRLINILTESDFDGVDLTWEYNWIFRQGNVEMLSKDNFTFVVQALREELDKEGYLLTATVTGRTDLAEEGYDVPKLSQYLDFINLMGYDLLKYYESGSTAQHFAPVDSLPGADGSYSVNSALKYWLDHGADPHKLVLGFSALGRYFQLTDKENGPFAPVYWSPWNNYKSYVDYPEMCSAVENNLNWTVVRNEIWQAPYAFNNRTWVSYDDEVSVALKMDLVSAHDLGGAMIDYYNNGANPLVFCARKRPLSSVVLEKLERTFVTTPKSETTTPASPRLECKRGGFFEYPGDCTRYYECVPKSRGFHVIVHDCDQGLGFDARVQNCVRKSRVRSC